MDNEPKDDDESKNDENPDAEPVDPDDHENLEDEPGWEDEE